MKKSAIAIAAFSLLLAGCCSAPADEEIVAEEDVVMIACPTAECATPDKTACRPAKCMKADQTACKTAKCAMPDKTACPTADSSVCPPKNCVKPADDSRKECQTQPTDGKCAVPGKTACPVPATAPTK